MSVNAKTTLKLKLASGGGCAIRLTPGRSRVRAATPALGIGQGDAEFLRSALLNAAREGEAVAGESDLAW